MDDVENPELVKQNSFKKLLALISDYSMVVRHKVNKQKSTIFL